MNLSGHALSLSHTKKEKDPLYKWDTSFKQSFSSSFTGGHTFLIEQDEATDEIRHPWYSYLIILVAICCGGMMAPFS